MKTNGIFFLTLILTVSAWAQEFKLGAFSAQVDFDSIEQLNDAAIKIFPFLPEDANIETSPTTPVTRLDSKSLQEEFVKRLDQPEFKQQYQLLKTNVEMFLVSKGIFFNRIPRGQESPSRWNFQNPRKMVVSPLLEKVVLDIIKTNADAFFSFEMPNGYYFGKAILMSAIPGVNLIYGAIRGQGSYQKDLQEKARKFQMMEKCSLRQITDDPSVVKPWAESAEETEKRCLELDSKMLKSYGLMITGIFASDLFLNYSIQNYGKRRDSFAFGTQYCQYLTSEITNEKMMKSGLWGSWIQQISEETLYNLSYCYERP